MATVEAGSALRHIRAFVAAEQADRLPDRELLEQFTAAREEAAFEALVRRHGPLVLGVCRRVLGNAADAEDAFQAAFLILARKAHAVRKHESLGGWLYQVAYRAALRARRQAAVRRRHERRAGERCSADALADLTGHELLSVLDEQLQALPERYRAPLVQRYLQGATCDEAARALGWPLRTLKRRLEQGRERLRTRLAHRGLGLPAALLVAGVTHEATAALPAGLTEATARAALQTLTGEGLAAATLAQGVLHAMLAARLKVAAALVLLAGLIVLGAGALAQPAGASAQIRVRAAQPQPVPVPRKKDETKEPGALAVAGRVLDADGKPLADAEVALVGLWRRTWERKNESEVVAYGKTDEQGRFSLSHKRAAPGQFFELHVLAGARGCGLEWVDVLRMQPAAREKLELTLHPEQVLRVRLFDLQGLPARGVSGRVVYSARRPDEPRNELERRRLAELMQARMALGPTVAPLRTQGGLEFRPLRAPEGLKLWPRGLTADAEGRVEIRGFAGQRQVHLLFEDDRFARQELQVETAAQPKGKEITLSLAPPRRIEGRLLCEDTGKPVAGAEMVAFAFKGYGLGKDASARTDAEGRFTINPYPGDMFLVRAWPPDGAPYVGIEQQLTWPRGAVRHTLDLKLPHGVTVKGRIAEAPSGQPLARVSVHYLPRSEGNPDYRKGLLAGPSWSVRSAADGTFRLVVPVGLGQLVVNADSPDLITRAVSLGELRSGKPGGELRYYHEVVPVSIKVKDDPQDMEIKLRRGVTLRGRVLGPDGKPVKRAVLFCGGELLRPESPPYGFVAVGRGKSRNAQAIEVRDGEFALPACDPDKTYRVLLLDVPGDGDGRGRFPGHLPPLLMNAKGRLGAAAELSVKGAAGKPVSIQLSPAGAAAVRLVDAKGKGVRKDLWLDLIVTPARGKATPEVALLGGPGQFDYGLGTPVPFEQKGPRRVIWPVSPVRPDAEGRVTIPALIPGATYRLRIYDERDFNVVRFERQFTVESGKTRDLPDLVVAP